jgi:DNA-binding XRE family transcriptional regulator
MIKVVGNSIRIICIKRRIPVTKLADDIQCNRKSLYNYINGNVPDLQTALRIANYFKLPLSDVFKIVAILFVLFFCKQNINANYDNCEKGTEAWIQLKNTVIIYQNNHISIFDVKNYDSN